jgi:hypothetical protein
MILQWVESQTLRRFHKEKRKVSGAEGIKRLSPRHFIDSKDESYGDRHGRIEEHLNEAQMDATRSTGYFDGGCAKAELSYRRDPVTRRLAGEIIVDQQSEIDAMNLWLSKKH